MQRRTRKINKMKENNNDLLHTFYTNYNFSFIIVVDLISLPIRII